MGSRCILETRVPPQERPLCVHSWAACPDPVGVLKTAGSTCTLGIRPAMGRTAEFARQSGGAPASSTPPFVGWVMTTAHMPACPLSAEFSIPVLRLLCRCVSRPAEAGCSARGCVRNTLLAHTPFQAQARALTTASVVMPSSLKTWLPGALMPKRSMPMTWPWVPTYFHQRPVTPASMAMRLAQEAGSTLSR